jgi:hypothetical protein
MRKSIRFTHAAGHECCVVFFGGKFYMLLRALLHGGRSSYSILMPEMGFKLGAQLVSQFASPE